MTCVSLYEEAHSLCMVMAYIIRMSNIRVGCEYRALIGILQAKNPSHACLLILCRCTDNISNNEQIFRRYLQPRGERSELEILLDHNDYDTYNNNNLDVK